MPEVEVRREKKARSHGLNRALALSGGTRLTAAGLLAHTSTPVTADDTVTEPVDAAASPAGFSARLGAYLIDVVLSVGLVAGLARLVPLRGFNESLTTLALLVLGRTTALVTCGRTPGMVLALLVPSDRQRSRLALRCLTEAAPLYLLAVSSALNAPTNVARAVFAVALITAFVDNVAVASFTTPAKGWAGHDRFFALTTLPDVATRAKWKENGVPWPVKTLSALCVLCALLCLAY